MNTPIYNFIKQYNNDNYMRLHMPGHKGNGNFCEQFDITEIHGADSLFEANGIIHESENNASSLFGTQKTLYSTQGSTLAIQTMLTLVSSRNKSSEKPLVIAIRNAHKAFINSCVLLDLEVSWIYPNYNEMSITSGEYSAIDIEKAILSSKRKPCAVYITSPDYLGKMADIKSISAVCRKHDVPLLCDNAHGAYLNFLEKTLHPIALGADMCCDSAHKTLPVLTGGAYLHISKTADKYYAENAKSAMALFASTSPSYLIMTSLDLCNKYFSEGFKTDLKNTIKHVEKVKQTLRGKGYFVCDGEPLKISLYTIKNGLYGYELAEILRKEKIECEYSDETHIVLMISTSTTAQELNWLKNVLLNINFTDKVISPPVFEFKKLTSNLSIREAALSPSEEIPVENSLGRICTKVIVACPPGIPVVVSGEVISKNTIKILKKYSIFSIFVLK